MIITVHNLSHGTESTIEVGPENDYGEYRLTFTQALQLGRDLCDVEGCVCGTVVDNTWALVQEPPSIWLEAKGR